MRSNIGASSWAKLEYGRIVVVKAIDYFLVSVIERRPYLEEEWLEAALRDLLRTETK